MTQRGRAGFFPLPMTHDPRDPVQGELEVVAGCCAAAAAAFLGVRSATAAARLLVARSTYWIWRSHFSIEGAVICHRPSDSLSISTQLAANGSRACFIGEVLPE